MLLTGGPLTWANAAQEPIPHDKAAAILQKHCHGCHGAAKSKGDLRLDKLNPDLTNGNDADHWREVLDRLNFGDMPPESEPPLAAADRELLTGWLVQEQRRASLSKNEATHFRRLTRREYERTMQDLLALPLPFGAKLPEDGRPRDGFRNNGEALRMSPLQYETFLQIAEEALSDAIVTGPPPEVHRYRLAAVAGEKSNAIGVTPLPKPAGRAGETFLYLTGEGSKQSPAFRIWNMSPASKEKGKEPPADGSLPPAAIGRYSEAGVKLPQFCRAVGFHRAFRKGETSIRVRVARAGPAQSAGEGGKSEEPARNPILSVAIGCTNYHGVELKAVGEPVQIDHAEFRTYDLRVRMESMPVPNTGPPADKNAAVLAAWNSAKVIKGEANPPRLQIEWIEFENPLLESWPPASHANILFKNEQDLPEPAYARQVVERFASRAYRRPLEAREVDRLMAYWAESRRSADSLEASLRDTLSIVLSSPQFLGLVASNSEAGPRQRLDDHELASRLSYFLWSTTPDDALAALARDSQLRDPAVLAAQVRRMIRDPKSWEFVEQFAEQWLELDRLDRVTVNRERYRGVDDEIVTAMRLESLHFFAEVLRSDLSVLTFVDSDFTCLNEALAAHYGVSGVVGPHFRRVPLPASARRGGVLTHASVLTGNSDGVDGHPVKRGMWLLKNLLDETPPPPPPNVPELDRKDPKVKGLTIVQAMAVHRNSTACAGCHRKIDPWGIAFEEYDAVGNWQRDGLGAELRKQRTKHPIESLAELPGGAKVDGIEALQAELLRSRSDDVRRALVRKVMAYALGRSLTLQDIEAADALVARLRERGDGMGALVELVVSSYAFQSK